MSAKTAPALRAQAGRLRALVRRETAAGTADIAAALVTSRSAFSHRAVLIGRDRVGFCGLLEAVERGESPSGAVVGAARPGVGQPVFVFPGHGAQWPGMGAELFDRSAAFAEAIRECTEAFAPWAPWSLEEVLRRFPGAPPSDRPDVVQPASFAMAFGLTRAWQSYGVEPSAVLGHSQGEVAAAAVAGALGLADAAQIIVARTRVLMRLLDKGAMAAISMSAAQIERRLERFGGSLSLAAVNGPAQVTVSGVPDALEELSSALRAEGVRVRVIPGAVAAGHSVQVEALREDLMTALAGISPRQSRIPFYSTVTGGLLGTADLDAEYWYRNARQPVRLDSAVRAALEHGRGVFLECGPHPMLAGAIESIADDTGDAVTACGTLRKGSDGHEEFLRSAARLYVSGVDVNWSTALPERTAWRVDLPTYAFQHKRFWPRAAEREPAAGSASQSPVEPRGAWRYEVVWKPVSPTAGDGRLSGTWLVITPDRLPADGWADAVLHMLRDRADALVRISIAADGGREAVAERIRAVSSSGREEVSGVVCLTALDESATGPHPGVGAGLASTLALMQALADCAMTAPLWLITRGAVAATGAELLTRPAQAPVGALGRVFGLEYPARLGGLVDLPETLDARTLRRLVDALADHGGEDQLAIRPHGVLARRLVPMPQGLDSPGPAGGVWRPRPDATVLITGGTGALAGHVARWLAANGAGHLLLASRRGPRAEGIRERAAQLEELGSRVSVVECDMRDRDAVRALLAAVRREHPLAAVVHTAGVGRLQALDDTTLPDFAEVYAAKAAGAGHLHALTRELGIDLDAFVLFSAVSAAWGVGRQGAYGAANAYLDALARHRRGLGLKATAVAWTGWTGSGMAVEDAARETARRHGLGENGWTGLGMTKEQAAARTGELWGLRGLDPRSQLAVLQRALDLDETTFLAADVDWERFTTGYASAQRRPLLDGIPAARRVMDDLHGAAHTPDRAAVDPAPDRTPNGLAAATPARGRERVLDLIRAQLADALGHSSPDEVPPDRGFLELGLDSVSAVQLRNRLGAAVGLRLPATVAFDHGTPRELADYVHRRVLESQAEADAPQEPPPTADSRPRADLLVELYERGCADGRVSQTMDMLGAAGRLRPAFAHPGELSARPRPLLLAEGPDEPALICLTPYVAPAGPHQYARFAAAFRGERDVWVLPHPGFAVGEALPADLDALFQTQAQTARECAGDAPFALLGYSSGGWAAHGTAARLEGLGHPAAGVVMLDSFSLGARDETEVFETVMRRHRERAGLTTTTAAELTAMAHYLSLFHRWDVPAVAAPTFLVRARDRTAVPPPDHVDDTVTVPGDHFTMIQDYAPDTAAAVRAWLADRFARR